MSLDNVMSKEEIYLKVDEALRKEGIDFERKEGSLLYDIPNLNKFCEKAVKVINLSLDKTGFYAQEIPYRELRSQYRPSSILIMHRNESK